MCSTCCSPAPFHTSVPEQATCSVTRLSVHRPQRRPATIVMATSSPVCSAAASTTVLCAPLQHRAKLIQPEAGFSRQM
jgi:hypothetical protein